MYPVLPRLRCARLTSFGCGRQNSKDGVHCDSVVVTINRIVSVALTLPPPPSSEKIFLHACAATILYCSCSCALTDVGDDWDRSDRHGVAELAQAVALLQQHFVATAASCIPRCDCNWLQTRTAAECATSAWSCFCRDDRSRCAVCAGSA
eukprot:5000658-Pleurochrysis_carterae.AAC.1